MRATHEIWIAAALLHYENPACKDFTVAEMVARAVAEHPTLGFRACLAESAISEAVATNAPETVHHRFLTATSEDRRRLYRNGDCCQDRLTGTPVCPSKSELPARYQHLVDWYIAVYCYRPGPAAVHHNGNGHANGNGHRNGHTNGNGYHPKPAA